MCPASLCTRVDIREEKLVATLQEVQEYIYFHWKLLLDVSSLKRPLNERNRRVLANVLPCDSIYEEYTKVCVYVLANFRLSPRSTILFLRFFLEQKKKRGEKEERKEGGKAGIAPWKLARLEKGEDSRKLKPACRRRQWGREKFDLDFPRNWYAYQYTGSFITLVDNSVLTRRLIRKRRNGLNARRTMQWVRVRCFRSIKREFLVFEIGWIRIAREGRKFHFFSLDFFSLFTRKEGGRRGKRTFLIRDFVNLKRSPVIIWKYQNFPVPWKRCWVKIVKIGNISSFFY